MKDSDTDLGVIRILVVFKRNESVLRSLYIWEKKNSLHQPLSHSNFIHIYSTHIY